MAINFGDVLDRIGERRRDELALTSDTGSLSWAEFTSRTNALAHGLLAQGLTAGDKVGFYLFNGADYVPEPSNSGQGFGANINMRSYLVISY